MPDEIKNPDTGADSIPENLKKYVGADGKLDVSKVSQGVLEAEQKMHDESQKRADADRAYAALAESFGSAIDREDAGGGGGGEPGVGRVPATRQPAGEQPLKRSEAQPVVQAFLEMVHPEIAFDPATNDFKNKEFMAGFKTFVLGLPVSMKQSIAVGDFGATEWALRQYKALKGGAQKAAQGAGSPGGAGPKPNFIEGGSPAQSGEGRIYTREEMRLLYRQNPKEYAKLVDDMVKAREEGRVKEE